MHKFPKIINKKWKRYSKIEKIFIVYLFTFLLLELFFPFINIDGKDYTFVNSNFPLTGIIAISTLVFIIFWNSSYTVKGAIKEIFGFEYNEAILNFGVLFLHASLIIYSKEIVGIIALGQSSEYYSLNYGFYVLGIMVVVGLIWNLFVALNLSMFDKKKINYTKVVSSSTSNEKNSETKVKSLFDR